MKCETRLRNIVRVVGILILFLLVAGCTINGGTPLSTHPEQTNAGGTPSQDQVTAEPDSFCDILEFNSTRIHDCTIVPLTEDDLKPYPEFGQYFEKGNNDTQAWRNDGTRPIAYFDCNESAATQFYSLSRKYEEIPNQPIVEFDGHYYDVVFVSYLSLHPPPTDEPTLVANTSDTGADRNNGSITGYS